MRWDLLKFANYKISVMRIKFILFFVFTSSLVYSQTGYKINFKIKSWKDTTVYLGMYYGESTYLVDTAQTKSGSFYFDGKKTWPKGFII